MTPSLAFSQVWKGYGPGLTVLRGLTFTLSSGEIALLVGENGAGKTTAFDIACGSRRADQGCASDQPA
jgi:ABC-type multidrug transport system ATPase subunit